MALATGVPIPQETGGKRHAAHWIFLRVLYTPLGTAQ